MARSHLRNPFSITKAVDLNDSQIEELWVKMVSDADELADLDHPASPTPTFILGAKGSGKTHLMRHQAYELQKIRYSRAGLSTRQGINSDGYVGLYVRCSGLQSSRFAGKRQSPEVWDDLFSFYFELWLAQHLLAVVSDLGLGSTDGDEADLVEGFINLFDKRPALGQLTISSLIEALQAQQRNLDYEINNCLLKGGMDVEITATRGKLIFGMPRLLALRYEFLHDVLFSYDVDEFENLTEAQQIHVNTIVREKEPPTTFRIGARSYGVKTQLTNSGGEENLRDSEFREINLDSEFRKEKANYASFTKALVAKRLAYSYSTSASGEELERHFVEFDTRWSNDRWRDMLRNQGDDSPHFIRLRHVLRAFGYDGHYDFVRASLSNANFPIVEKLNLVLFYQELARGRALKDAVHEVAEKSELEVAGKSSPQSSYKIAMQHYSDDLAAQLLKENRHAVTYNGLATFILMSAGIPRALLTVLRSIFEWSVFNDESPFEGGQISLESQHKGVLEASNWYYSSMRKAGEDGVLVQAAVDRLANVFRINRFGDKPIESSLTTFSVAEQDIDADARAILKLAEARAFIHRIPSGQKERNSDLVTAKFQLSPMLAPRWELPIARRGTLSLSSDDFNAIFGPAPGPAYDAYVRRFRNRVNAPFKGEPATETGQIGLFE